LRKEHTRRTVLLDGILGLAQSPPCVRRRARERAHPLRGARCRKCGDHRTAAWLHDPGAGVADALRHALRQRPITAAKPRLRVRSGPGSGQMTVVGQSRARKPRARKGWGSWKGSLGSQWLGVWASGDHGDREYRLRFGADFHMRAPSGRVDEL
jgi:hypothetical protein